MNPGTFWFYHIIPHVSCRNEAEPLPSPDLYMCVHAFRLVGVDWGLSGVSALQSHLPITMCLFRSLGSHLAAFSFSPSSEFVTLFSHSCRDKQESGRRKSGLDLFKMDRKCQEEGGGPGPDLDLWLACIFMQDHRLKPCAASKERMWDLFVCAAGWDIINWGLFVCLCECLCACLWRQGFLTAPETQFSTVVCLSFPQDLT